MNTQIRYFEGTGKAGLRFKYKGPDTKHKKVPVTDTVACVPVTECPPGFLRGGFKLELFDLDFSPNNIPNFNNLVPTDVFVPSVINYPVQTSAWAGFTVTNDYAVLVTALLEIKSSGTYTFSLGSDDGSRLFLENTLVINNNSPPLHSFSTKLGTFSFPAPGFYEIRVRERPSPDLSSPPLPFIFSRFVRHNSTCAIACTHLYQLPVFLLFLLLFIFFPGRVL